MRLLVSSGVSARGNYRPGGKPIWAPLHLHPRFKRRHMAPYESWVRNHMDPYAVPYGLLWIPMGMLPMGDVFSASPNPVVGEKVIFRADY